MLTAPFKSFIYNLLIKKTFRRMPFAFKNRLWKWISKPGKTYQTKIHGIKAFIPSGYAYPYICRTFPSFNNPLLELAWQTLQIKKEKLNIIDAGAAIGDTALFLKQNLPPGSSTIFCIEGDRHFAAYLKANFKPADADTKIINAVLSSQTEMIPGLVHHHSSSLAATGETKTAAFPLDEIWKKEINRPIDILKTDVEGYDGKVLAGSAEILKQLNPSVIFEFHPLLVQQTGNDPLQSFQTLKSAGYLRLFWYNKFGEFIADTSIHDMVFVNKMIQQSINGGMEKDIHFDIIAPGNKFNYDLKSLAGCLYARTKKYSY